MPCSQGALSHIAVKEASGDIDWSTGTVVGIPFARESLQKIQRVGHPDVIIGSRDEVSERARFTPAFYGGWIAFNLSPGHMATIFPWVLGADASGTTFALAETLQTMGVLVDTVTATHEFYNGLVNRIIISGRQNGPNGPPNFITVAIQCIFQNYNPPGTADAYPTLTLPVTGEYAPLIFEDLVLTLNAAVQTKSFVLDVNNFVEARYVNNLEPTQLCPARRVTSLTTVHPYDSGTSALYNLGITGVSGTKTLAITNSNTSITATFGSLQTDIVTPTIDGKHEIDIKMRMIARKSGSTPSASFVVDSTP